MRAVELLEQVKALPPGESASFADLFHQWEQQVQAVPSTAKPAAATPDYQARLERLFPDGPIRTCPQELWDTLRGDRL